MKILAGMPWRLDFQFTGLAKVTLEFFEELARQGGQVRLFCAGPRMTRGGFSSYPINMPAISNGGVWSPLLNSVAFSSRFSEKVERLEHDVLHCFNTTTMFLSKRPYLFQTLNPTYAYVSEVLEEEYPKEPQFDRLLQYYAAVAQLERTEYQHAQVIVTRSPTVKENIAKYYEVEPELIHVIPHGWPQTEIAAAAPRKRGKMKMILFSGTVRIMKGFTYLIDAMETVAREVPDVVLVVAGRVYPQEISIIMRKIKASPVSSKVVLAGFLPRERYQSYLEMADVGCIPSMAADPSLSILEYVAHGIPVVTTPLAGLQDINRVGIEIPPRDAEATANALIEALTNPDVRGKAARNAPQVLRRHNWAGIVRDFMKLYEEVQDSHL
ncbi:MAG: glycosyltransferase family 4 protein [Candidatus Geothermarchaeales archaeon]